MLPGLTGCEIAISGRTHSPMNSSHISLNTVISGGLVTFVVRQEVIMLTKHSSKISKTGQRKRGRPLKRWSDQIRNDTGLPLLTAQQYVILVVGVQPPGARQG